jgi:hypothetical protein
MTDTDRLRELIKRALARQEERSKLWPNPMGDGGWSAYGKAVALEAVLRALDGDFTELERLSK